MSRAERRVCVGEITGAHGVRGLVKVRPFTAEPASLTSYGALTDEAGVRRFDLELLSLQRGQWVARIADVADREAASALSGVRLFAEREAFPVPEDDEFYHTDLLGLRVENREGQCLGSIRAVHDFGAGNILEISLSPGGSLVLPFNRQVVPVVDIEAGRIVVDPPVNVVTPQAHEMAGHQSDHDHG